MSDPIKLSGLESHCVRGALWQRMDVLLETLREIGPPGPGVAAVRDFFEREFWCCAALWCRVIDTGGL